MNTTNPGDPHQKIETKLFEYNGFFHGSYVHSKLLKNGPYNDIDMAVSMMHFHEFNKFMETDCKCTYIPKDPLESTAESKGKTYKATHWKCPNGIKYDVMLLSTATFYKQSDLSDLVYTKNGFGHKRYPTTNPGDLIYRIMSGKYCVFNQRPAKPDPLEAQRPEWQCNLIERYNNYRNNKVWYSKSGVPKAEVPKAETPKSSNIPKTEIPKSSDETY